MARIDDIGAKLPLMRPGVRGASRTLAAVANSTVFTWKGRNSGCFERMSAAMPAMCGAAYELPVPTMRLPPRHATSMSIPGAKNSVGGSGL